MVFSSWSKTQSFLGKREVTCLLDSTARTWFATPWICDECQQLSLRLSLLRVVLDLWIPGDTVIPGSNEFLPFTDNLRPHSHFYTQRHVHNTAWKTLEKLHDFSLKSA